MWMSGEVTSMPSFTRSGPVELELLLEPALGEHVDGVARELGEAHASGESTVTIVGFSCRVPRRKQAPARPRRRIRKLRLFGLLLILVRARASMSFTFGLVTAVASEIP